MNHRSLTAVLSLTLIHLGCSPKPCPSAPSTNDVTVLPTPPEDDNRTAPLRMTNDDGPGAPQHADPMEPQAPKQPQNPAIKCRTDSDCAAGQACASFIDYGGCESCDGGTMATECRDASRVSCPDSQSCSPEAANPRCTDPRFRDRCPHTVLVP